jgi:glycine/D-amino acid oxidase-like deaminating enzyme
MTQMTTAHLTNMLDDRYFEVEKLHGREGARLAADSHTAAIDRIETIVRQEGIDCDFQRVDGYLFLAEGDERATLERELEAAHRAGLRSVAMLERAPFRSFDPDPCLRFPNQGQFHPLKYLARLAQAIQHERRPHPLLYARRPRSKAACRRWCMPASTWCAPTRSWWRPTCR